MCSHAGAWEPERFVGIPQRWIYIHRYVHPIASFAVLADEDAG